MAAPSRFGFQINWAPIDVASSGDNTLISAVTGCRIVVVSLFVLAGGSISIKFQSSTTSDLTGPIALTGSEGFVLAQSEHGWFATVSGELLNLNTTTAAQVSGSIGYFVT